MLLMLHKGLTDIFRSSPRLSSSLKETLLAQMMIRQRLHFHFKESTKRSQKEDNLRLAFQLSMHVSCKLQVEISLFRCKESGMLAKYSGLFHYQRYFQMMSPFFLKKRTYFLYIQRVKVCSKVFFLQLPLNSVQPSDLPSCMQTRLPLTCCAFFVLPPLEENTKKCLQTEVCACGWWCGFTFSSSHN